MISFKCVSFAAAKSMDLACTLVTVSALWIIGVISMLVAAWGFLLGVYAIGKWAESNLDIISIAVLCVIFIILAMLFAVIFGWCGIRIFKKTGSLIKAQTTSDAISKELTARDGLLRGASRPATACRNELLRSAVETEVRNEQLVRSSARTVRHIEEGRELEQ